MAVFVLNVYIWLGLVAYEYTYSLTHYLDSKAIPLARDRMKPQRTDTHKFVHAHIARPYQIHFIQQTTLHTDNITIEPCVCTKPSPNLHLTCTLGRTRSK